MVIWEDPEPDTLSVSATLIVSTVELSEVFLIVILPLCLTTLLLKFKTMFASSATFVASSAGEEEDNSGQTKLVTDPTTKSKPPEQFSSRAQLSPPKVPVSVASEILLNVKFENIELYRVLFVTEDVASIVNAVDPAVPL